MVVVRRGKNNGSTVSLTLSWLVPLLDLKC